MPVIPTFDMAEADRSDFGLEEEVPSLESIDDDVPDDPGTLPSRSPRRQGNLRCADCDGENLFPDYLGRLSCRDCGSLTHYPGGPAAGETGRSWPGTVALRAEWDGPTFAAKAAARRRDRELRQQPGDRKETTTQQETPRRTTVRRRFLRALGAS